jgi:hypothetical protein
MSRDQIAKNMMFATANLINNEDPERLPELTTEYWNAAVAFNDEFCDDATAMALAEKTITDFVNTLQTA